MGTHMQPLVQQNVQQVQDTDWARQCTKAEYLAGVVVVVVMMQNVQVVICP